MLSTSGLGCQNSGELGLRPGGSPASLLSGELRLSSPAQDILPQVPGACLAATELQPIKV